MLGVRVNVSIVVTPVTAELQPHIHTPLYTALYGVVLVNGVSIPITYYNRTVAPSRGLSRAFNGTTLC